MKDMIEISGNLKFKEGTIGDYDQILEQICKDATYGTYLDFPQDISSLLTDYKSLYKIITTKEESQNVYAFKIAINEKLFPLNQGGIQHFISTVAGDLLNFKLPNSSLESIKITDVSWESINKHQDNKIKDIRSKLYLNDNEPVLAFSFKPRFGLSTSDFIKISQDVLECGFHIVEADTRKILLDDDKTDFIEFAKNINSIIKAKQAVAFSLNLSNRTHDLEDILDELKDVDPLIIKIDASLDGFTLMQRAKKKNENLIITCYPLLKNQLKEKIPSQFLNDVLAYCGADIVYPGGRANIKDQVRSYDAMGEYDINQSIRNYKQIVDNHQFIPTIAGGISPGQLHIFYELYGPDTFFFLGGAIALHKKGPRAGAQLCKNIINEAVSFRDNPKSGDVPHNISKTLILEIHDNYNGMDEYLSPMKFFEQNKTLKSYFSESK